jgi:uncharacterized protein YbgA (DUF1722 family)/uncharacterized protein YbbK (DUF523 family)
VGRVAEDRRPGKVQGDGAIEMSERIRIGISTCLLGEKVRYDGGHKLDRFLRDTLGRFVEYVPVCPEYECGLGVPRESMRLVGDPASPRLVTARTRVDMTDRMAAWARKRNRELEGEDLCGFVFKSNSPSSGMERVKVWSERGMPVRRGVGIFAAAFMEHFPLLPVEEEGRLHDPGLRENFIERVFALRRWRSALDRGVKRGTLVRFHSENKLLIMSHSQTHLRQMGRLVARAETMPPSELFGAYQTLFLEALALRATPAKNANVLQHIMGYFKRNLSGDEKRELLEAIRNYRKGYVPLVVPITLVNHYVGKYKPAYLMDQSYLSPHPIELALRNHA